MTLGIRTIDSSEVAETERPLAQESGQPGTGAQQASPTRVLRSFWDIRYPRSRGKAKEHN